MNNAKSYTAHARFRKADGGIKQVEHTGTSRTAAKNRRREAMSNLAAEVRGDEVSGDTRMARMAELWCAELDREVRLGSRAPNTVRLYRSRLKNWILPATTELQARELTAITCDKLINKVRDETGHDNGKSTRTVLTGLCGYATRYGAMSVNPARSVGWPPVYGWVNGGWLDPVNVVHRIKEALTEVGYGWVTSHVFRKTVGSVIDEADLPLSALADQLGNTQQVADKHYRKRRVANKASADALEGMFDDASDA